MNKYLVTIKPDYNERNLQQFGEVVFKSTLIQGLYVIETTFKKSYLEKLPFVINVEENRIGSFDV